MLELAQSLLETGGLKPQDEPSGLKDIRESLAKNLARDINEKGLDSGLKAYRKAKSGPASSYYFDLEELMEAGNRLWQSGKKREAVEVFKIGVAEYPWSYAAHERLDPKNTNAEDTIKRLESDGKKIDPNAFETYVGEYESPVGILTVSKQGDKLFVQPGGSSKEELIPETDTRFTVPTVGAVVVFAKDESGHVTKMVVRLRGENFEAKKIK